MVKQINITTKILIYPTPLPILLEQLYRPSQNPPLLLIFNNILQFLRLPLINLTPPLEDQYATYETPFDHLETSSPSDNIIQTSQFEVPLQPTANYCATSSEPSSTSPYIDLLFDPTDYLHFSS